MKIGCCAYSYRQYLLSGEMSLEDFVDIAADLGVEGVELTAYYFPTTDRAYLNSLKRHCLLRGVDVSGAAVGSKLTLPARTNAPPRSGWSRTGWATRSPSARPS